MRCWFILTLLWGVTTTAPVVIAPITTTQTSTLTAPVTTTTTTTTTTTPYTPTPTSDNSKFSPTGTQDSGPSTATIAASAVAAILFIALAIIAFLYFRHRRRAKGGEMETPTYVLPPATRGTLRAEGGAEVPVYNGAVKDTAASSPVVEVPLFHAVSAQK